MARIGFLMTRTPWYDQRQYHRQGPALLAEGHTVVYLAGIPPEIDLDYPYEPVPLSAAERKIAARTGGLNLLRKVARARLDLLQICSVELLPAGIAIKLLRLTKVVYDCREDMPSAMRDFKMHFPKPVRIGLSWMTRLLEEVGDRVFDGLVTADPATADLHRHMAEDRKAIFYNLAPTKHFPVDGPTLAEREYDLGIIGSISEHTGVFDIVRAVARVRDQGMRLRVVVAGWLLGSDGRAMTDLIDGLGLTEQFEFCGAIDHLKVPELLYNTRIGVVAWRDDYPKLRHNIPSKTFEFMAARMVIVATDLPSTRVVLKHDHNAIFYASGNVAELAEVLYRLLGDLDTAQSLADQARRDFLSTWNLDVERTTAPYTDLYDRLTRQPRGLLAEKTG
jgi:glycosyltransferase involved in cell wall biosynthesis